MYCTVYLHQYSHPFHLLTVFCFTTRDVRTEMYISLPGLLDVGCWRLLATLLVFQRVDGNLGVSSSAEEKNNDIFSAPFTDDQKLLHNLNTMGSILVLSLAPCLSYIYAGAKWHKTLNARLLICRTGIYYLAPPSAGTNIKHKPWYLGQQQKKNPLNKTQTSAWCGSSSFLSSGNASSHSIQFVLLFPVNMDVTVSEPLPLPLIAHPLGKLCTLLFPQLGLQGYLSVLLA